MDFLDGSWRFILRGNFHFVCFISSFEFKPLDLTVKDFIISDVFDNNGDFIFELDYFIPVSVLS